MTRFSSQKIVASRTGARVRAKVGPLFCSANRYCAVAFACYGLLWPSRERFRCHFREASGTLRGRLGAAWGGALGNAYRGIYRSTFSTALRHH